MQAAGCLSEGESVASLGMGPPMMLGGPSGLIGDRGSCSADSGVRGEIQTILVVSRYINIMIKISYIQKFFRTI